MAQFKNELHIHPNNITIDNFSSICRFCMEQNETLLLIFKENDVLIEKRIDELSRKYLRIEVAADDGLPLFICTNCSNQLIQFHNFQRKSQSSIKFLQHIRDTTNVKQQTLLDSFCTDSTSNCKEITEDESLIETIDSVLVNGQCNVENMPADKIKIELSNSPILAIEQPKNKRIKSRDELEKNKINRRKTRPEMCEICGTMQTNIKMHLRIHGNIIVFECDHCGRKFNQKSNIRTHFKVHLNERPYHCKLCPFKFLQLAHLRRHMLTHTGEKPYKCDMCPKAFAQSNSLAEHRLIHTQDRQVPCPHCDKMFLTKKALKSHVGVHTGERPFKCEVCGSSYVSSSGLSAHRRIHKRDNQMVQCDICQQVFETRKIWKNHMRDHGYRMR